jgi:hypothetical protein
LALANITLLHWNIEQFSNNKLNTANGAALINYIAAVVAHAGANIVSLIEVKNSAVNNIIAQLVPAINLANGQGPPLPNRWESVSINSQKNNEAYVILFQTGNNFNWLLPVGAGGPPPLNGLSNQALVAGAPGGALRFNSSLTTSGGRRPYYVTFRTSDTNNNFSIVTYHTMFGFWKGVGVRNVGLLAQSQAVDDAGATINMQASLTCGDFNINFNPAVPGDYNNLINMPSSYSTDQLTTLVNNTPPNGFPTSVQYRLNAYDNIFRFNTAGAPPVNVGFVQDLIDDSTTIMGGGSGLFAAEAGAFVRGPIPQGHLIQNIPPDDFEDAWHIVRDGISNHLPVYVTMAI